MDMTREEIERAEMAEIAARLDADRLEAARQMSPGERLLAGPALFDVGLMMMRAGLRNRYPHADPLEIERMVMDRLRRARQLEAGA